MSTCIVTAPEALGAYGIIPSNEADAMCEPKPSSAPVQDQSALPSSSVTKVSPSPSRTNEHSKSGSAEPSASLRPATRRTRSSGPRRALSAESVRVVGMSEMVMATGSEVDRPVHSPPRTP